MINPQGYNYGIDPQNVNPFWKQSGNVVGVTATASVLPIGGIPNVEVERTTDPETGDVNLDFTFSGLKGEPGEPGENGQDGQNGQDGVTPDITITASVMPIAGSIQPMVSVTKSGTLEDPHFAFEFDNIKGQDGRDGVDGQDGKDGADGQNGQDGRDGQDGVTPDITITASIMPIAGSIQPMVSVTKSGTPEAPNFDFEFENLGGGTSGSNYTRYALNNSPSETVNTQTATNLLQMICVLCNGEYAPDPQYPDWHEPSNPITVQWLLPIGNSDNYVVPFMYNNQISYLELRQSSGTVQAVAIISQDDLSAYYVFSNGDYTYTANAISIKSVENTPYNLRSLLLDPTRYTDKPSMNSRMYGRWAYQKIERIGSTRNVFTKREITLDDTGASNTPTSFGALHTDDAINERASNINVFDNSGNPIVTCGTSDSHISSKSMVCTPNRPFCCEFNGGMQSITLFDECGNARIVITSDVPFYTLWQDPKASNLDHITVTFLSQGFAVSGETAVNKISAASNDVSVETSLWDYDQGYSYDNVEDPNNVRETLLNNIEIIDCKISMW